MDLQMTWQPNLQRRKSGAPPLGLRNLGNTCYLNSVLQCLTYTPPLANFCLRGQHTRLCRRLDGEDGKRECPFCILEKRISRSLSIDGPIDAPSKIESCLRLFAEHFQCGRQEDAHEFLRYVIDACHSTCVRPRKAAASSNGNGVGTGEDSGTVVREIFGGALLSQVKCLSCSAESNKIDEIMDISLDLYQSNSLVDALRRFFRPEILNGSNKYCCNSCKKLSEARKQIFVLEAPNVLVVQLKRFEGMYGAKINKDIAFEEALVLSSFMCKASQDPHPEYNLFGSIVHSGCSSESGHYYAYIKDPSGRWYCCNDAYVSLSTSQAVLSDKVYILFYARSNEKPKFSKLNHRSAVSLKRSDAKEDGKLPGIGVVLSAQNGEDRHHEKKEKFFAAKPPMKFSSLKNSEMKRSAHRNENGNPNVRKAEEIGHLALKSDRKWGVADGRTEDARPSLGSYSEDVDSSDADLTSDSYKSGASVGKRKAEKPAGGDSSGSALAGGDSPASKGKTNADEFVSGGLEKYKDRIAAEAFRKLRSCSWADEVREFMRAQKRQCVEAADTGARSDKTELKKVLIANAKKAFTSKLPNSIRQSLIDRLKLLSLGRSLPDEA